MLRLDPITAQTWIDLDDIRVCVRPMSAVIMARAAEMAEEDGDLPAPDPDGRSTVRVTALTAAVAQCAITEWAGPGDADGNPAPVTPDYVRALMAIKRYELAFFAKYVARAFAVRAEKNGSAPSLNGTLEGAQTIADPVTGSVPSAPQG